MARGTWRLSGAQLDKYGIKITVLSVYILARYEILHAKVGRDGINNVIVSYM